VRELSDRLIDVTLAALPVDPESDCEMVVGWTVVETSAEDRAVEPNLPERYTVPVIDHAVPVAVRVVKAVLMELAKTAGRDWKRQLHDLAERVEGTTYTDKETDR
jgi:hypothetical protein